MASSDSETYEDVESGFFSYASCGDLRKGGYVVLKNHPCKIVDFTTAKTGKHGKAKASLTGIDIFTLKKYEENISTDFTVQVPAVERTEYQVLDIDADGNVTLKVNENTKKEGLTLPTDKNFEEMVEEMQEKFARKKTLIVSVVAAYGKEKIVSYREKK